MKKIRVLIACESSGVVREAFNAYHGFEAISCDLLPAADKRPDFHYQGDVLEILNDGWDLMIAHPPCTYLSVSGIHWNNRGRGWKETYAALGFVRKLLAAKIPYIALENLVGIISTRIRGASQYIQPYDFGADASKKTGLWLKGLPALQPTRHIPGRLVEYPEGSGRIVERWANQTNSGQNKLGKTPDRWALRSVTYPGIAAAMAAQWTAFLKDAK